ncbi:uncharacterized protein LOC130719494 [Lotus japonicus]|uniref:uncharacterized protein LOC130719494 n=1 Tax=Lotus japonicus TaxID=34305 RepID=UPI002584A2C3|nr:uncharacterized protein LOC130719494 [Lotus japonicus]
MGHNTDNCWTLRKEIERLIKAGHWSNFVSGENTQPEAVKNTGVVTLRVNNYVTKKVFLDQGSSADIIYGDAFERLSLKESDLKPYTGCLVGFTGDRAKVRGYVELDTAFGEGDYVKKFQVKYLVLLCKATYNVLLGRDTLNKIRAIISTAHLTVKYPACNGKVGILRVDQEAARACYAQSLELYGKKAAKEAHRVTEIFPHEDFNLDLRDDSEELRPQPAEEIKSVHLSGRALKIGSTSSKEQEDRLVQLLKKNLDLFAWTIKDVLGIDPNVISHHLSIQQGAKPVVQARRRMGEEKDKAVQIETQKLLEGKFIREVQYPTWLANVVMMRKENGKWRMCTNYTSLNKVCPKDSYPLPNVDKLVDGASGNEMLSLMDAYSGYNKIMMYRPDEEKTAFMTSQANYCYKTMPFGLKNAGATYQRLMDKVIASQVGRNMEVGIEVNPDKCKAIVDMKSPSSIREVKRLTGRLAALSRFFPKAGDRATPFFTCLKKNTTFQWTGACEEAFQQLKELLASPPMLAKPTPRIPLILYLAVTDAAVSTVLLQEENKQYKIIYFVSHTLQGAEVRYQKIEKAALAILKTARRLRPYFQSFQIKVKTDIPKRQVLQKPYLSGRLVSWSVELSEYDISYEQRGQVTIQSLIDFVAELTPTEGDKENAEWVLSVDGSSNESGSGAGVSIESPDKMLIEKSLKFGFRASNNQSEYEALIAGLRLAIELGVQKLYIKGDSQLVVKQVRGEYQVKDPQLSKYLEIVQRLMQAIEHVRIEHIPRSQNECADALAKLASTGRLGNYQTVIQEILPHPSTDMLEFKVAKAIGNGEPSWMDPIIDFLSQQPQDESKNTKEKRREASFYTLVGGQMYRQGIMSPMLKCVDAAKSQEIMAEVHEGVCSSHIGGRYLAVKVLRAGFYWPTIKKDCLEYVKKCSKCQVFSDIHRAPPEQLTTMTAAKVRNFLWRRVVCRFGVPMALVMDNGTQFTSALTRDFCADLGIDMRFTSVEHPQTNGQAEAANKVILNGLKKKLDEAKGWWVEEFPDVLWAYNTTVQTSTGETPYRLTYGSDTMLPVEVENQSWRVANRNEEENNDNLIANLIMLPELQREAHLRNETRKLRVARKYATKVVPRKMKAGDLVLRERTLTSGKNKLTPNWEGPFRVKAEVGVGAYKLEQLDGRAVCRTWNASSLRQYYS